MKTKRFKEAMLDSINFSKNLESLITLGNFLMILDVPCRYEEIEEIAEAFKVRRKFFSWEDDTVEIKLLREVNIQKEEEKKIEKVQKRISKYSIEELEDSLHYLTEDGTLCGRARLGLEVEKTAHIRELIKKGRINV